MESTRNLPERKEFHDGPNPLNYIDWRAIDIKGLEEELAGVQLAKAGLRAAEKFAGGAADPLFRENHTEERMAEAENVRRHAADLFRIFDDMERILVSEIDARYDA